MTKAPRPVALAATMLLVLTGGLAACSGDEEPKADPTSSTSLEGPDDAPTIAIDPVVHLGKVVGHLKPKQKHRLEKVISGVAVKWIHAAYLDGTYPRKKFAHAWPGFTAGARRQAHQDRALTSNAKLGPKISGVSPSQLAVTVDLLAIKRRPVGSTAHVKLRFDTEGDVQRQVYVGGRLRLTPTKHGWKVFAYTINRGDN